MAYCAPAFIVRRDATSPMHNPVGSPVVSPSHIKEATILWGCGASFSFDTTRTDRIRAATKCQTHHYTLHFRTNEPSGYCASNQEPATMAFRSLSKLSTLTQKRNSPRSHMSGATRNRHARSLAMGIRSRSDAISGVSYRNYRNGGLIAYCG